MNRHERRIQRSRFEDFLCGGRRWDIVPGSAFCLGDTIAYREFDFILHDYTGRSLEFVVRLITAGSRVDNVPDGFCVVALEPTVGGISLTDIAELYGKIRVQQLAPSPRGYIDYMLSQPEGAEILSHLVAMFDGALARLFPSGSVIRWFVCEKGPLGGQRIQERELAAFNGIFSAVGQYEARGVRAVWVSGQTKS